MSSPSLNLSALEDAELPRTYSQEFYDLHRPGTQKSAGAIVPVVVDLVQPRSVVDVGCGTGIWLAAFRAHGVADVLGIDGEHVAGTRLDIPADRFLAHDLREPLRLDRKFDLVVCLEVSEHLRAASADTLLDTLTRLGPVVLFSAAIPSQGGTGHVNEQWPEYWAARFERRGYLPVDAVRKAVWRDPNVEVWYAQNILVFVRRAHLARVPALARARRQTPRAQLAVVHPRLYAEMSARCAAATLAADAAATDGARWRAEAEAERGKADQLAAEVARYQDAVGVHEAAAERSRTEAVHWQAEAARHRLEAERLQLDVACQQRELAITESIVRSHLAEISNHRAATTAERDRADQLAAEVARYQDADRIREAAAERSRAEAVRWQAEAARRRLEAGRLRLDVARHRGELAIAESTVRSHLAEIGNHRAATTAERARAALFEAQTAELARELAAEQMRASRAVAETASWQAGATAARTEAARSQAEVARLEHELSAVREEVDGQRAGAAALAGEAAWCREEVLRFQAEADVARARAEFYRAEAENDAWRADPRFMSLRRMLRAFPVVVSSAIGRCVRRRRDG